MEATHANVYNGGVNHAMSIGLSNHLVDTSASVHPMRAPSFESYHGVTGVMAACHQNNWPGDPSDKHFQNSIKHPASGCSPSMEAPTGVSNCYVFKSRLQEYAQKVGLSTPTYETIREGPSHEPFFRSTVIVGGVRYDSLPGFFNRKAAEQSAAEVALLELSSSGQRKESISVPVHETGLCKNVLQEYAQKMNYAIPTYTCQKNDTTGRTPHFSCTVEIGGIQYIGASSRNKKEAEIKAARTALLAIQSSGSIGGELGSKTNYAVVPCKRKVPETGPSKGETAKPKKRKKPRFKNKLHKHKHPSFSGNQIQAGNMAMCVTNNVGTPVTDKNSHKGCTDVQVADNGQSPHCFESSAELTNLNEHNDGPAAGEGDAGHLTISEQEGNLNTGSRESLGNTNITPMINAPTSSQLDALLPDCGVDQKREAPPMTDLNHAEAGNNDQGVGNNALVVNTQASRQLDAANSDSGIPQEEPAQDLADTNALILGISLVENANVLEEESNTETEHNGGLPAREGDTCHLTICQQEGDINTGSGDSHGTTNITHMINAPTSSQLDVLLPDYGVDQIQEAPPMTDMNHEEGNNDQGVSNNTLVVTQASRQLDGVNSDSRIGQEEPAQDLTDTNALIPGISPVENVNVSEEESNTETRQHNGGPPAREGDACHLTICQQEGDINTGSGDSRGTTNITPMINAPTSSQLDALLPDYGVDQIREAPPMTDMNHAEAGNNDQGVDNNVVNTQASRQFDGVNSDSRIGQEEPSHDLTDTNALFPGISLVEQAPAENVNLFGEGRNTGTRETKVQETSDVNVLTSSSDQTVKASDPNAEG